MRVIARLAVARYRLCGLADLMMLFVKGHVLAMHLVQCHAVMAMMAHEVPAMHPLCVVLDLGDLGHLRLGNGRAGRF